MSQSPFKEFAQGDICHVYVARAFDSELSQLRLFNRFQARKERASFLGLPRCENL